LAIKSTSLIELSKMSDYATRFSVQGKKALVTGASKGLGAEIAIVLADAGADLAITGRDQKGLEATKQAIINKGRRCISIQADLQTVEGPRAAASQALEFFGSIDILVNNAGIFHRQSILETSPEAWDEMQAVNLRAPFLLAQAIAPAMIKQRSGKIVNVSSVASVVGCEGHAGYSASKGGMNILTRVMATEWGPFNIQTNAIAPAVVMTDMAKQAWGDEAKSAPMKARMPVRRFGEPVEIADMVLYLASPASNFVCGQIMLIDGGYSAV
jgi:NAD(P)-dependent dehydrogenase (short-subunit alcohol dehydrogenase family)